MLRTYTIEVRVDYDTEEKHHIARKFVAAAARQIFTQTLLMAPKGTPQVAVFGSDFFATNDDISILEGAEMDDPDTPEGNTDDEGGDNE